MIQTVKCSPLVDIKFNPGFYDALCTLNLFFLQAKILCLARVGMSLARCLFPKRSEDLVQKIISPVTFDTNCSFKR